MNQACSGRTDNHLLTTGNINMRTRNSMDNLSGIELVKRAAMLLLMIGGLSESVQAWAEPGSLKTQTGKDIGLSISAYQYREPGIMSLRGMKTGLDFHAVKALRNDLFVRGDLRGAFGLVNYDSYDTGSANGEPDWYVEARALLGKDWVVRRSVLAAYTGIGYRYLFNDGRGITSTGYGGYRRASNYTYLPIGIIHRRTINDNARLESTLEYDTLLFGRQVSSLSDVGGGYSDVTNNQNNGYGLKFTVMYQKYNWAIGPYLDYWTIGQSDIVYVIQSGVPTGLIEPNNHTVEFGLKASQRF
jgi:hypothetical protein